MRLRKIALISILPVLLLLAAAVILLCRGQERFQGSRVKKPDAYLLDIQQMNGTDWHTFTLSGEDQLRIHFQTDKGTLHMELRAPDGIALYQGSGEEIRDFTLDLPQDGIYTVVVEARHAKGVIHIQRIQKEDGEPENTAMFPK